MSRAEVAQALAEGTRMQAQGRSSEAVAAYRRAVALSPTLGDAHYNLGIALRSAGELREACLAFRTAARLVPDEFDAVQNVVETLARAVERGQALFQAPPASTPAGPKPVSIVVCSIDDARLARMQASFRAALGAREHEFIAIRDARSLCEGYERGLRAARHPMVVFSHDDVELVGGRPFDAIERALEEHAIVGVAGSRRAAGPAMAWAGHPHVHGFVAYPAGERHKATMYSLSSGILGGMQFFDGLLFAARRGAALAVGFDAVTFDGFHLYDLDFAYRAHRAGHSVAVTTEVLAVHASEGGFGESWRHYAQRFLRKFPELDLPEGRSFYFGRELASREHLARFHAEFNGLGAVA